MPVLLFTQLSQPTLSTNSLNQLKNSKTQNSNIMKNNTWKTIIQVVISVLTAALTALGTTSCMGHGPIAF